MLYKYLFKINKIERVGRANVQTINHFFILLYFQLYIFDNVNPLFFYIYKVLTYVDSR